MSATALKSQLGSKVNGLSGTNGTGGFGGMDRMPLQGVPTQSTQSTQSSQDAQSLQDQQNALPTQTLPPASSVHSVENAETIQNVLSTPSTPSTLSTQAIPQASPVYSTEAVEAVQSTPPTPPTPLAQEIIITPPNSNYIALANTNALDIINENLKGQPLSLGLFDIIKAPTGGMTAFSVPSLAGDDVQKELVGIILDYHTPRAYWQGSEPVEGTPPDCYSPDSITSSDGRACNSCVYNTFGSKGLNGNGIKDGDSNAKACKESVALYLLRQDEIMPVIMRVPVTSKFIFQRYLARLVSKMIPLSGIVTKITLEKATSNGGQPYAKFVFEAVEMLTPDEASHARAYGKKFGEMLDVGVEFGDGQDITHESNMHHESSVHHESNQQYPQHNPYHSQHNNPHAPQTSHEGDVSGKSHAHHESHNQYPQNGGNGGGSY